MKSVYREFKEYFGGEIMEGETEVITSPIEIKNEFGDAITVSDVNQLTETTFETSEGIIHLIHEITLGDAIISVLLMSLIIFHVLDRVIRR